MDSNAVIKNLNQCLLDTENLANDFLPLDSTLSIIKSDVNTILAELKKTSEDSEELSDKVFYINRYADLVKKIDSIFDARTKRIQNSLSILSKMALIPGINAASSNETDADENSEAEGNGLSPEQCAKIFAVLQEGKED